jgi:hypothetical protein
MGILEELFKISTGMEKKMGDQSLNETSMDVNYPEDTLFKDANINKGNPYRIEQPSGAFIDQQSNLPLKPVTTNPIEKIATDKNLFQNIFGLDVSTMQKNWKEKGGFEGLMANPGFILGLGIIQSSAQGKSIGADLLNNAIASGAISAKYADRIKERSKVVAPISDAQRKQAEAALTAMNVGGPGWLDKLKNLDTNQDALYQEALDKVADKAQALAEKEAASSGGKRVRLEPKHYRKAVDDLILSGEIDKQKGSLFGMIPGSITAKVSKTEKSFRAKGGPVEAGQDYIVGEEGPEMFVSETNGTIINNDDSKVVSMLLESNPQLKNISRARAVKILKARFPDYF